MEYFLFITFSHLLHARNTGFFSSNLHKSQWSCRYFKYSLRYFWMWIREAFIGDVNTIGFINLDNFFGVVKIHSYLTHSVSHPKMFEWKFPCSRIRYSSKLWRCWARLSGGFDKSLSTFIAVINFSPPLLSPKTGTATKKICPTMTSMPCLV